MFKEALSKGEFVVTCEFVPGRGRQGPAVEAPVEFARKLKTANVPIHAISLTDCPGGNPAILPDVLAAEIQKEGVDALVHFSCRDMNRNAVEARATALSRQGIHNLLVITGDYPESGHEGEAAPVFDLDSVQALRYLRAMNQGLSVPGRKPGTTETLPPTHFALGGCVSPFKLKEEELLPQYFKMEKKILAGADFIITQLGYDMRKFFEVRRYLASRGLRTPVIGNVYVLSYGAAKVMAAGGVPGCVVTEDLLRVLEEESKADDKGKKARMERAAKMVAMFRGMGFAGVHIGGFALKAEDYLSIVRRAGELQDQWADFIPDVSFGALDEYYAFPKPDLYAIDAADADPVAGLGRTPVPLCYRGVLTMHRMLFKPNTIGFNGMRAYFKATDGSRVMKRLTHVAELASKRLIFECRDCGDCGLPDLAYCCPQSKCAKQQRNGPCGGSRNGMCEVYPDEKICIWTRVYDRLRSVNRLEDMRNRYVPPRNWKLAYTSGWANYFLNRDHTAGVETLPAGAPAPRAATDAPR